MNRMLAAVGLLALIGLPSNAAAQTVLHTTSWGGSLYELVSPSAWGGAEAFAVGRGGRLTSIQSQAENDLLTAWVSGSGPGAQIRSFRIGLYEPTPGNWVWSDGSPVRGRQPLVPANRTLLPARLSLAARVH